MEDRSKAIAAQGKYQALTEEGHLAVAVEDMRLALVGAMAAEDVCWAVGHGGGVPSCGGGGQVLGHGGGRQAVAEEYGHQDALGGQHDDHDGRKTTA